MSFTIRPDASPTRNIRRLVRRELGKALDALDDPAALGRAETVHEVRTRCKKVRGAIRLARPGLGRDYGRINADVRDAARQLGPLRDATAMRATFDALVGATHGDRADPASVEAVRAGLAARAGDDVWEDAGARMERAASLLAHARARAGRVSVGEDPEVLVRGLERTYRRGRRDFRRALRRPSDENLHAWRRSAKYGWHHAKLLRPLAPGILRPLGNRLKDLSDGLGDDHDLALLRATLLASPRAFGGPAAHEAVDMIDAVRADLQDRCIRLGARLYAESPPAFATRVGRYWDSWAALGPERPTGEIGDLAHQPADRPPRLTDGHVAVAGGRAAGVKASS